MVLGERLAGMGKWKVFEFLRTSGVLGGGSVTLAIVSFFLSGYEHYKDHNVTAVVFAILTIVFFCFGSFLAWSKERDRFESEVAKHGNPSFELKLGQIDVYFDSQRNVTLILLCPTITNHGSTSAALTWQIQYNSPMMRINVPFTNLPYPITRWRIESTGQWLVLHQDRMLPFVTAGAVETGHSKSGRLLFDLPGNHAEGIKANPGQLFVGCVDRISQMTWQGAGQTNFMRDFAVLPGENVEDAISETPMLPL